MRKLSILLGLLALPAVALTTVDVPPSAIGTNSVTTSTVVRVSGKLVSLTIMGQATSSVQLATTSGTGSSINASKALVPVVVITAQYVTNLAAPIYLRDDTVSMIVSNAGVKAITNRAILFLENP